MTFVDTSFWIALMYRRDRHHPEAMRLVDRIGNEQLVTSNHVVGETWTFLGRRAGHAIAVRFLDRLDSSNRLRIERVSAELELEAWRWLRRHDERSYSFVDATSFALMRSLRIPDVLAFDADFESAGFSERRA